MFCFTKTNTFCYEKDLFKKGITNDLNANTLIPEEHMSF